MTDNPFIYRQQIGMRKLANRFISSIKATSAQRILVTSVHNGDGKATFINHLYSELQQIQMPLKKSMLIQRKILRADSELFILMQQWL